jgi:uncharacterized protein (DUF1778 family)
MSNAKKKRGRPPKGSANVKSVHLDMRIEPTEKDGFRAAAELAGLDLSAWIRERLRRAARKELENANQEVPFLLKRGR